MDSPSNGIAAPGALPLDAAVLRKMELESIAPFPEEIIIDGKSETWEKTIHKGDVVVAVYEFSPAVIKISEPFPYDEFVLVLEGTVRLSDMDDNTKTYKEGDIFLLPKGWMGTWDMPAKFREMVIIETKAWQEGEF